MKKVEPPATSAFRTMRGWSPMMWTMAGILLFLWLLGFVGAYTAGSWMHIFLVLAVVMAIAGMARRSRAA
jgi:hypothetical protein